MSDYDKMHNSDPIYADEADLVYEPVSLEEFRAIQASTPEWAKPENWSRKGGSVSCDAWLDWDDGKRYCCTRDDAHSGDDSSMHAAEIDGEYTNWADSWKGAGRSPRTFTAQALAFAGAKFIKKKAWKTGRVYIDNYDVRDAKRTWCFIHPTDVASDRPQPVFLYMLEGDDWVEVPHSRDQ